MRESDAELVRELAERLAHERGRRASDVSRAVLGARTTVLLAAAAVDAAPMDARDLDVGSQGVIFGDGPNESLECSWVGDLRAGGCVQHFLNVGMTGRALGKIRVRNERRRLLVAGL